MKVAPQPAETTEKEKPMKVPKPGSIAAKAAEAAEKAAAAKKPKVKAKPGPPPDLYGNLLRERILSPEHSWKGILRNLDAAKETYELAIAQGAEATKKSKRRGPKRSLSPQKSLAEHLGSDIPTERPRATASQRPRQKADPGCHPSAEYFRPEAQAGNAHAQFLLADCFLVGDGYGRDVAAARVWLEKAAAQNFAPAQSRLGTLLVTGDGGPKDYFKGYDMWQKAVALGDETAQTNLERFEAALAVTEFS